MVIIGIIVFMETKIMWGHILSSSFAKHVEWNYWSGGNLSKKYTVEAHVRNRLPRPPSKN